MTFLTLLAQTFLGFIVPVVQAQAINELRDANDVVNRFISIGNVAIYVLVSFAVIYFIYAVVIYFIKGKEGDEKHHEALMRIFWALVGFFVIVSMWGLVNILLNTFKTNTTAPVNRFPTASFTTPSNNTIQYKTNNSPADLNGTYLNGRSMEQI